MKPTHAQATTHPREASRLRVGGGPGLVLGAILALGFGSQACRHPTPPSRAATEPAENEELALRDVPESWIHFENGVWIPVVDDLGEHLEAALAAQSEGDDHEAAVQCRYAADALDAQIAVADKIEGEHLTAASKQLRDLARDLEQGNEIPEHRVEELFHQAYRTSLPGRRHVVPEEEWFYLVGSPDEHLKRAEAMLGSGNRSEAQDELLKASVLIGLESTRSDGQGLEELTDAAASLQDLQLQIRQDETPDQDARRMIYAAVDHALATHHLQKGEQAADVEESRLAGHELLAAVDELDRCAGWLQESRTAGLENTMQAARDAAGGLAEIADASTTQVARALSAVRTEAGALGKRLASGVAELPGATTG